MKNPTGLIFPCRAASWTKEQNWNDIRLVFALQLQFGLLHLLQLRDALLKSSHFGEGLVVLLRGLMKSHFIAQPLSLSLSHFVRLLEIYGTLKRGTQKKNQSQKPLLRVD